MRPDYYAILGVTTDASSLVLKRAYRRLALQYHPDRHPDDEETTRCFQRLVEAYSVLGDAEQRAAYDAGLDIKAPIPVEPGSTAAEWVGGLLDRFFGVRDKRAVRGLDLSYTLVIDFACAMLGGEQTLSVPRRIECPRCLGRSIPLHVLPDACTRCHGNGELQVRQGLRATLVACPDCLGRGYQITEPCGECQGQGEVEERYPLTINVPAGVKADERLLIRQAGHPGRHGGEPGDLFVHLSVREHALLELRDLDILCERPITFWDALNGCRLKVPSVDGIIHIKVPPESVDGEVLKVPGYGARLRGTQQRGDLLVTLRVEMPTGLGPEQREVLARAFGTLPPTAFPEKTAFEALMDHDDA